MTINAFLSAETSVLMHAFVFQACTYKLCNLQPTDFCSTITIYIMPLIAIISIAWKQTKWCVSCITCVFIDNKSV